MEEFPAMPAVDTAPEELFSGGHLWLLEKVDGDGLRFQLQDSGVLRFGDEKRVYSDHESVPTPYQHAVGHIQENLDRHALRQAVDDVERVVFFGAAMHHRRIDYDWEQTPSFLGFDVWAGEERGFLPPDTVDGIFSRLGLESVNVFERELHTRDFDPDAYTIPQSAWYDGPAAGVVIRDKRGNRAQLRTAGLDATLPEPLDATPDELVDRYGTDTRFERVTASLEADGKTVTVDTLYERVLEQILREQHSRLFADGSTVDLNAFQSALAARASEFLNERFAEG